MKCGKRIVLFTLFAMNLVDQPAPEVTIEQGILSGKISTDGSFFEYVGIPYATTNSSTRFKAPLPPPKWKGVFKAVDEFYQCPQNTPLGVLGVEDCLKINVYVPAQAKRPLPIMVYIHGGAFIMGNGGKTIVGPHFLVKHDVILVSFNYRLGALGFLCLGIKEAPGNAGLKDQVAALRWIQKNIAAFGGDPDNVTIFGTSAGGTSVSLLVASDATNGLFKRAIVHSGSSLTNWAINYNPVSVASSIVSMLGYDTKEPEKLYELYSKLSYKDLVLASAHIPIPQLMVQNGLLLPCVEKTFPGVESVLSDLPYNLLTNKPKNIPLMYSSTDREGLFFIDQETEETLHQCNKRTLFGEDLIFASKDEENKLSRKVKEYYFGKEQISEKNIMKLSDLYTHLNFEVPMILEAEKMARTIDAPVYSYYFTYSGGRNFVKVATTRYPNEKGACHGDDLLYIFNSLVWPYRVNDKDKIIIDRLTTMLTNFAKYGNPTPNDLPLKWAPHSKDQLNFLYFGDEMKMGSVPNPDTYQLWKDIYIKHRKTTVD
uniref:Carboxylic ester hydrolase n=1 Tax=Mythimna separata TaxID=271217 RepID=A0A5B9D4Q8_MYTSE|nr:carboxylesterase 10 [Mythimna separata]